jgi:hypothetical protein
MALDFATMVGREWRIGFVEGPPIDRMFYSEVVTTERGSLSALSAEVRLGDVEAQAHCRSVGSNEDASIGVLASRVAALVKLGEETGNPYQLPDLAILWLSFELERRLVDNPAIDWGQPDVTLYASQVLDLLEQQTGWHCSGSTPW